MTSQQQILDLAPPTLPTPAPPSRPPLPPPPPAPFAAEQLCYVHCHLCDTVLAVSVPCTSLFKTVTVRCGHCTNLLPVNMKALFLPAAPAVNHNHHHHQLHFTHHNLLNPPQHLGLQDEIQKFGHDSPGSLQMGSNRFMGPGPRPVDGQFPPRNPVTNRPPEKRQRVPSAYNRFIKEEIQRIKVENPDISHREAFSAAAKNWAHFPHIHFGLMPDQMVKKTATRPQEGEDTMMKDDFLAASANVGVSPY